MDKAVLSSNLRQLRHSIGLSQAKLAKLFSVPKSTYATYEYDFVFPPLPFLCRLADFYGVSIDWLLGRKGVSIPYDDD